MPVRLIESRHHSAFDISVLGRRKVTLRPDARSRSSRARKKVPIVGSGSSTAPIDVIATMRSTPRPATPGTRT